MEKTSRKKIMMAKVDKAIDLLRTIKSEEANFIAEELKFIYSEIVSRNYGLVFEKHLEEIDKVLKNSIPYLKEDMDKRIDNGLDTNNYILVGDNLASLSILKKTHKENIQVIYIDPPYNTGNDMVKMD